MVDSIFHFELLCFLIHQEKNKFRSLSTKCQLSVLLNGPEWKDVFAKRPCSWDPWTQSLRLVCSLVVPFIVIGCMNF